jgi:hypothetical protein
VTHQPLDVVDGQPLGDQLRGVGVPQIVEPQSARKRVRRSGPPAELRNTSPGCALPVLLAVTTQLLDQTVAFAPSQTRAERNACSGVPPLTQGVAESSQQQDKTCSPEAGGHRFEHSGPEKRQHTA